MARVGEEGERTRHGSAACTSAADHPTEPFQARSGSAKNDERGSTITLRYKS